MSTAAQTRLLHLLLGALGASTACTGAAVLSGCGGKVVVDLGSGGNGGTGGGSSSSSSSGGGALNCAGYLVSSNQQSPMGTCAEGDPNAYTVNINCFAPPGGSSTCADAFTEACVLDTYSCGLNQTGQYIACGPVDGPDGQCCYTIVGDCAVGRPFTIDGHARLGALIRGEGWAAALAPAHEDLDAATRAALADAWGKEALFEHASIASFARFVLQLLALGAPADLIAEAQRALADEHDHARTCLGLASAYAGEALSFGPIAIDGALAGASDAAAIADSLAREGAIAETVAALLVQRAAEEARDPVVKEALARIADQEAAHAALAWRALGWMVASHGPAVRAAVMAAFADAERCASLGAVTALSGDAEAMRAHGYLPVEERRAVAREALGRVVGPAATALLGARAAREHDLAAMPA